LRRLIISLKATALTASAPYNFSVSAVCDRSKKSFSYVDDDVDVGDDDDDDVNDVQ